MPLDPWALASGTVLGGRVHLEEVSRWSRVPCGFCCSFCFLVLKTEMLQPLTLALWIVLQLLHSGSMQLMVQPCALALWTMLEPHTPALWTLLLCAIPLSPPWTAPSDTIAHNKPILPQSTSLCYLVTAIRKITNKGNLYWRIW